MTHQQEEEEQIQATSTFVKSALEDLVAKGPDGGMYRLMEKNIRKRGDFKLTRRLYLALTEHVTQVVSNKPPGLHDALIDAVFSFDFVIKDMTSQELIDAEALRDGFATCALSFVSAKATLAPICLRMLIKSLQQLAYSSGTFKNTNEGECSTPTPGTQEKENKLEVSLRVRIVDLVLRVVKLVPTAGASLVGPLLAEHFPHRFRHVQCLRCYVRGVLEVARELPRISSDLVALLVERCLEIDVEIKLDDSTGAAKLTGGADGASGGGDGDDSGDESDDDLNLLGFGSPIAVNSGRIVNYIGVTPSSNNSQNSKDQSKDLPPPVAVDEMAEKLDMLMLELFEHIDVALAVVSTREVDNRRSKEETARLWNAIHGTFQAKILLTHRSKFVQFLLLRFCALHTDYALVFVSGLEGMCVDRMVPHVRRTNAVHFLASFAVRTTALNLTAIAATATRLLNWVVAQLPAEEEQHRLRAQNKSICKDSRGQRNAAAGLLDPADLTNHRLGVLYSISQALFYIMCFRGAAFLTLLQSEDPGKEALEELMVASTWSRLCHSPLQPMAYCLERVRVEFLATARRLKLLSREESYGLMLKSDETLRAMSTMAGLDLTTPNRQNPTTPRSAMQLGGASEGQPPSSLSAATPRTPGRPSSSREAWSVPIRTPGSRMSSLVAMTPKTPKQTPNNSKVSSVSGKGEFNKCNPLDSFFPFDPYLLRNSFCFVSDIYCEWEPCYEEDEDDDHERDNHEVSDSVTSDTSVDSESDESDSDSEEQANMEDSTGTSYGSHVSMMSVDSAAASPSPMSLLNPDGGREMRDEFEGDEEDDCVEESDPYDSYTDIGNRRARAESIGDW